MKDVFTTRLKKSINERGLSQRMLATLIGTTEQSVSRWVRGNRTPDVDALYKMCKALDVSADYLLGLSEENEGIYRVKYERIKGKVEAIRTRCTPGAEEYFDKNQLGLLKIVPISNDNVLWQKLFSLQDKLNRIGGILSEPDRKGTDGAVEPEKAGRDTAGGNQETV